jgi:uncharacterized membrane protein YjjB (DUF3815 family)
MDLLIILIVIGLIAWLNVYLAQQRGRSELGWAIGALLFGLLSTLLLLVIGTTHEKKQEDIKKAIKDYK